MKGLTRKLGIGIVLLGLGLAKLSGCNHYDTIADQGRAEERQRPA